MTDFHIPDFHDNLPLEYLNITKIYNQDIFPQFLQISTLTQLETKSMQCFKIFMHTAIICLNSLYN